MLQYVTLAREQGPCKERPLKIIKKGLYKIAMNLTFKREKPITSTKGKNMQENGQKKPKSRIRAVNNFQEESLLQHALWHMN